MTSMPRYQVHFECRSKIGLTPDAAAIIARDDARNVDIRICNMPAVRNLPTHLSVQLFLDAEHPRDARMRGERILLRLLDALSYTTNSAIRIERPVKVLDWTPD